MWCSKSCLCSGFRMVMLVFPWACFTYDFLYDLFWRYIGRTIHIEVDFPEYLLSLLTARKIYIYIHGKVTARSFSLPRMQRITSWQRAKTQVSPVQNDCLWHATGRFESAVKASKTAFPTSIVCPFCTISLSSTLKKILDPLLKIFPQNNKETWVGDLIP